ncbi:MAG: LLM class flavin-dependent oxidoreductase [Micromonosporaceae bacterium]
MTVRYAVGLPNVAEFGDPRVLADLAVAAEEYGWDGVFLWDHVLYHDQSWPVANPTVSLAAIAARTTRVRLGALMTALPRRRVQVVAREVASLDVLSGGRMVFGAALGSMDAEYAAFGEDPSLRVRAGRLDESLTVLSQLWSGAEVDFRGRCVTAAGVRMLPTPVQRAEGACEGADSLDACARDSAPSSLDASRPGPGTVTKVPIWTAGRWPARPGFRRAARWDGVVPTHADYGKGATMPASALRTALEVVASERGGLDGFDVALEGRTGVADAARIVAGYAEAGLTWWIEAMGWWRGGVAEARSRITAGPPVL